MWWVNTALRKADTYSTMQVSERLSKQTNGQDDLLLHCPHQLCATVNMQHDVNQVKSECNSIDGKN